MSITQKQLLQILPNAGQSAGVFVSVLNTAMVRYQIVGPLRMAAFIAQIGHESGQFRYVRELGNDQYLSKYDTGSLAKRLGNTPEADGDGQKYRGRGLIQITGRANYMTCGEALALDLLNQPELLEKPQHACMSAAWYWAPYWQTAGYGVDFPFENYERMAEFMRRCKGKVMVSINDHPDIRRVFEGFHFETTEIRYTSTNQRQGRAEVTGELIIMNWVPSDLGGLF